MNFSSVVLFLKEYSSGFLFLDLKKSIQKFPELLCFAKKPAEST